MNEPDKIIAPVAPVEEAPVEKKEEIKLPTLDKGATSFYDIETGVWWLGVPLNTLPLFGVTIIDSSKLDFLKQQQAYIAKEERKKSLMVNVKEKAKAAREGFGSMMSRIAGKELIQ